jgi:HD-like signal output (HDOD) protein
MVKIEPDKIDRILSEIEIPTLPSIATAIMERTLDEKTSARQLAEMVEKDQALAAKVLKVANSPFYRRIKETSTIRAAVVLLGLNVLKSIVLSISVINMFNDKKKNAVDLFFFWQHSISCAVCARTIANKAFPGSAEDAFAAGLLHDLGKVVFDQAICIKGEYQEVLDIMDRGGMDIIKAEQDVIGIDHAAMGRRLLEKWNLPMLLCQAVGEHHRIPEGSLKESESKRLCAIVHVADLITNHLGLGITKLSSGFIEPSLLKQLDLSSQDIQEMSLSLKENISAISEELGIPKAEPKTYFEVLQYANAQLGKLSLDLEQKKMALERRAIELSGLNKMSTQLQASMKLSDITSVLTSNALTILGSKKVRCMIRLNNLRIMVTDSFLVGNDIQTRSGVAGATKELLDRTSGLSPKGGGIIYAPIKVEDKIIGMIESIPLEEQHEDLNQKTLLLRTIADVGAQAIQRATLFTKNIKAERLAAISKTAIAANHEINTPLTTILLKLDTLLREGSLKEGALNALKDIKNEAMKIRTLVRKMLDISDVVETDYLKSETKTEKMLDLSKAVKKEEAPAMKSEASEPEPPKDDTPIFEDYLTVKKEEAPAMKSEASEPEPLKDNTPGFEDYFAVKKEETPTMKPKASEPESPKGDTPGFEDYLDE